MDALSFSSADSGIGGFRSVKFGVVCGLLLAILCGCSSAAPPAETTQNTAEIFVIRETPCGEDEARFHYCDSLLPNVAAHAAPEPFTACPGYVDIPQGVEAPLGTVAAFSVSETEVARRRVGPGHSCCYSWCAKIETADPSDAEHAEQCLQRGVTHESYCIREPEADSSGSHAGAPYDRCPAAIKPPQSSAFSAPEAALLDLNETGQRRAQGTPDCCYGWCSRLPHGLWSSKSAAPAEDQIPGAAD